MNIWTLPPAPPSLKGIRHVIDAGPTLSGLLDLDHLGKTEVGGEIHLAPHFGYIESDGYLSRGGDFATYCAHHGEYLLVQFYDDDWAVTSPEGLNAWCRNTGQPVPIEIGG